MPKPASSQNNPSGGAEVTWNTADLESGPPINSIAELVAQNGFCIVRTTSLEGELELANKEVLECDSAGADHQDALVLEQLPIEVSQGFLGEEGSYRVHQLEPEGLAHRSNLEKASATLVGLVEALADQQYEYDLGCILSGRTATFLCETTYPKQAPPALSEDSVSQWLDVLSRQRLMVVLFLGKKGRKGTLEIQPLDREMKAVEVSTEPGMIAVVRADLFIRRHTVDFGSMYSLSAFALSAPGRKLQTNPFANELYAWAEGRLDVLKDDKRELAVMDSAIQWRSWVDHVHFQGKQFQTSIRGMAVRGCPCWDPGDLFGALDAGVDVATEIPLSRWDNSNYYDPDADEQSWSTGVLKTYNRHGAFMEGSALFDNKFFKIAPSESKGMDPMQRHILDAGYEALHSAGENTRTLLRSLTGVYAGAQFSEMPGIPQDASAPGEGCAQQSAGTGCAGSIMANRFSFVFGMMGPSLNLDTEASTVLVCMQMGSVACSPQKHDADLALVTGSSIILVPTYSFRLCVEKQMGRVGRCFTFDASGDGYIRGEGTVGFAIDNLKQEIEGQMVIDSSRPSLAILDSVAVSFCPYQAALTAPHGAAQQALLSEALAIAGISGTSVDALEPHGTGQPLWDAVETVSASKILFPGGGGSGASQDTAVRPVPLLVSSNKSGLCNPKQPANGFQILKVIYCGAYGRWLAGVHLREVLPSLVDVVGDSCQILSETLALPANTALVGVTGLGYGGTLAHSIFQVDRVDPAPSGLPELKQDPQ
mmetsp:Transcript_23622/g.55034  ORF Transcript_23622/g.55034 Transcript_23622/m.55034 type:complete len:765 (+) Transcript_23622:102-2396(+)